jgi:hypothetical protein
MSLPALLTALPAIQTSFFLRLTGAVLRPGRPPESVARGDGPGWSRSGHRAAARIPTKRTAGHRQREIPRHKQRVEKAVSRRQKRASQLVKKLQQINEYFSHFGRV